MRLQLEELYVADLDAIEGGEAPQAAIAALAREGRVMLDAGAEDVDAVQRLLELGIDGVVVGTETLSHPDGLLRLQSKLPDARVIISLDLRAGRVISRAPGLRGLSPGDALMRLGPAGGREVIVLDLARVGTAGGPDVALIAELSRRFPRLRLLAGGGIRDADDLKALHNAGAEGALVGTAVHTGVISRHEIDALRDD